MCQVHDRYFSITLACCEVGVRFVSCDRGAGNIGGSRRQAKPSHCPLACRNSSLLDWRTGRQDLAGAGRGCSDGPRETGRPRRKTPDKSLCRLALSDTR